MYEECIVYFAVAYIYLIKIQFSLQKCHFVEILILSWKSYVYKCQKNIIVISPSRFVYLDLESYYVWVCFYSCLM